MLSAKKTKTIYWIIIGLFVFFTFWWLGMAISSDFKDKSYVLLSEVYGLIALIGGINGLFIARGLGFLRSYFGKAIVFLSLGLLLQEFGQLAYSYLNSIKHVALPYPSIPDIGYFGSIPLYILGAYYLMVGLGVKSIIKKSPTKLIGSLVVAVVIVGTSYWLFLKGYDTAQKTKEAIFFDFAYPLGQAIYVSLSFTILLCVTGLLGGLMKKPIIWLQAAFITQYIADSNFLYQTIHGTWAPSGYGDYLYMTAYFLMSISLIWIAGPIHGLRQSVKPLSDSSDPAPEAQ